MIPNLWDLYQRGRVLYHQIQVKRLLRRVDGELEKRVKTHVPSKFYELKDINLDADRELIITTADYLALPDNMRLLYQEFKDPPQRHPAEEVYRQANRPFAEDKWREGAD